MEHLKLFGTLYATNCALWLIVSAIPLGVGALLRSRLVSRRIEGVDIPERDPQKAVLHTFTRSLPAFALVQAAIVTLFPPQEMGPLSPHGFVIELLLGMLVFDVLFYFAHRVIHHRFLWRIHELHHRYRVVRYWARNADSASQVVFIALFAVPVNFLPLHMEVKLTMFVLSTAWNLLQHVGYEIFPRWRWISRVFVTPTHHSMHHTEVDCHYGYYFTFCDDLFGTTHPEYRERFLRGSASSAQPAVSDAA